MNQIFFCVLFRGLEFSTYAPRRWGWVVGGGVKPPIHFNCVLHAKRGWVGPDSMYNCVRTKWKAPYLYIYIYIYIYVWGGGGAY